MAPQSQAASKVSKSHHPSYAQMIEDAIGDIGHGSGASRQAIKRWIAEHYPDLAASDKFETNFRAAVKNLVGDGAFVQPRGPSGKIKKAGKSAAAKSGSLSPVASAKITKRRTGLLKQPEQASRSSHTTKAAIRSVKMGSINTAGEITVVPSRKRIPVTH